MPKNYLDQVMERSFAKIVEFLLDNPVLDFSKKDIAEGAGVSRSTLYKYFPRLKEMDIVKKTRKYQNTTLYKLNEDSEIVNEIGRIQRTLEKNDEKEGSASKEVIKV
ncbi:MAG: winged helix-turn-helix domain-containing protein, partial [Candidatus Aenigmatarchaeota archaeon]